MTDPFLPAAEPWNHPPELPGDPMRLCLVEIFDHVGHRKRIFLLHHARERWSFPDRSSLSNKMEVLRWAYVNP